MVEDVRSNCPLERKLVAMSRVRVSSIAAAIWQTLVGVELGPVSNAGLTLLIAYVLCTPKSRLRKTMNSNSVHIARRQADDPVCRSISTCTRQK